MVVHRVRSVRKPAWRRHVAVLAAVVLASSLLQAPAHAAGGAACDRTRVLNAWRFGGSQVRAAAEAALTGPDADVCTFLSATMPQRQRVDDRLAVNRMAASGGPAVRAAAQRALDATDGSALTGFLTSGWSAPADNDLRLRVNQMMANGGSQLRAAAQKALDAQNPVTLRTFVETGWLRPWTVDLRLRINQILNTGGPEVKAAAQRALDVGTTDAYTQFLDSEWELAAARDQETGTVADLTSAAKAASAEAAEQTQAAKDAAARARTEAEAARQAAQDAADATERAHGDAQAAATYAAQAADAATKAAAAAREAVSAANAASAAARQAANAASRAARAAAEAGEAASRARDAAAAAAQDQTMSSAAHAAAQHARDVATAAHNAAVSAEQAGFAAQSAGIASTFALMAAGEVSDAADAAVRAVDAAKASGANAAQAQAAAAKARAAAARATRAARAASAFAATAATAAFNARDAANRAVADAQAAAVAADAAADHAGHAVDAAREATDNANAATASAQAAVDLVGQARAVYEAARRADDERIATEAEQADEAAKEAAAAAAGISDRAKWDAAQAAKRTAETNRLIAEAVDPATPRDRAVGDARRAALALAGADGPWTRAAAQAALSGDDDEVIDFVRTGVALAAGQDDRTMLQSIADTGTPGFLAAAEAAKAGTDAEVAAFLTTRDYPERAADDRIAVNRVVAGARAAGNTVTVQRGQQALDDGSGAALRQFLAAGQYEAAAVDERVRINQILADPDSGPETRAMAQAALDGPPGYAQQFLTVGRYAAAQRDQDSAAHDAVVTSLLAEGSRAAAAATRNALDAQSVAATARGDAGLAVSYAQQAAASANEAAGYARQAQESADAATASAARAAASARTAATAAQSARASAAKAAASARWAQSSASEAWNSAHSAVDAYHAAKAAAEAAGQDAAGAIAAAQGAYRVAIADAREKLEMHACGQFSPNAALVQQCQAKVQDFLDHRSEKMVSNGEVCGMVYRQGSPEMLDCLYHAAGDPLFDWNIELDLADRVARGLADFMSRIAPVACMLIPGWGSMICSGALTLIEIIQDPQAFFDSIKDPHFWLNNAGDIALNLLFSKSLLQGVANLGRETADLSAAAGGVGLLERTDIELAAQEAALARLATGEPDFAEWLPALEKETEKQRYLDEAVSCELPGNSFAGATRVLMADGTTRPIADIRVGDRVRAGDPDTGETRAEPVTGLIRHGGPHTMVDVTLDRGGRLSATADHPFWDATRGAFVHAGALRAGHRLSGSDGRPVRVRALTESHENLVAYNLTVARLHTYYVTANGTAVLVHNGISCPVAELPDAGKASYQRIIDALTRAIRLSPEELRGFLKAGELDKGNEEAYLRRMFLGTALERAVAQDPLIAGDPLITHLGNSKPGQKVADFEITVDGKTVVIDITGGSESSINAHYARSYIDEYDQIIVYPSFTDDELKAIFNVGGGG